MAKRGEMSCQQSDFVPLAIVDSSDGRGSPRGCDDHERGAVASADRGGPGSQGRTMSPLRLGLVVGVVAVLALLVLASRLGYQTEQARKVEHQRQMFLQAGKQAALNLTTIDFKRVESDIQRLLDSATRTFHDDFQKEAPTFTDVVRSTQSTSEGTVTEAGIESVTDNTAQILVAVSVRASNAGAPDPEPRHWRMRISVVKVADDVKVSTVAFVP